MYSINNDGGNRQFRKRKDYTVQEYECSGEGRTTTYEIFDGIQVIFMSFKTNDTFKPDPPAGDLIEISWCKRGRVECKFANQTYTHASEGDFWIDSASLMPVEYDFPSGEFEAVTIYIDRSAFSQKSIEYFALSGVNIQNCCKVLGLEENWYISRIDSRLHHIFQEMCNVEKTERIGYFRIKALEIMYYVDQLTRDTGREITYYSKDQVEAVKRIWKRLITHLDERCTIEDLAKQEEISMSVLRNIFSQMYGAPPYTYLKKYKMNMAARLLQDKENKIGDVAGILGYTNASKFAVAFRDVFGVLPKDYRKK